MRNMSETVDLLISFAVPRAEVAVVVEAERADREGALAHAAVHQHPGHLLRPGNQLRTRESQRCLKPRGLTACHYIRFGSQRAISHIGWGWGELGV